MTLAGSGWQYLINGENPEFDDGSTVLNFAAIDKHGNVSEYFGQKLNIDSDTPTLKITTDGSTEVSDVVSKEQTTLIIVPADNHIASVKISGTGITGESVISAESSAYKFTIPEAEGKYSYTVKVTDKAGREASKAVNVTYDKTAPVVNATYITTESKNKESKVQFPINWTNATKMTLLPGTITETVSGIASADYFVSETIYQMPDSSVDGLWIPVSVKNGTVASQDIVLSDNTSSTTSQYVYFRVTDNAGNTVYLKSADGFRIDTELPSGADLGNVDGNDFTGRKLSNGDSDVTFTVTPSDSKSGVNSVQALYKGNPIGDAVTENKSGEFTLTVSKDSITGSGMAQVGVRVFDNSNNQADFNLFNITIDTTCPSDIKISELMDADPDPESTGYTVNKTFKVSGTANDDQSLEKVELQYLIKGETGYKENPEDSDWTTYTNESGDSVIGSYTWSAEIDSTATTFDGKTFKIRLKATDSAGNVSYGPVKEDGNYPEIIVNQDTDIPVITVDGMKADGRAFISQRKITGSVEDDDGNIDFTNFDVSEDGTNWKPVTQLGTSRWSYTLSDDGSYTLYFKVTDAAGNEFSNSSSQKIVIKGDDSTSSTTGTLTFTVDTLDPDVSADLYKGETKLETQADRKYSAVVDNTAILKITANDQNGLAEVGAYIGTRAEDDSNVAKNSDSLVSGTEYELNVPLPSDEDLQEASVLTYYAKDGSGRISSHTYTITVDNVAPSLTVSLPSSTTSIAGDTTVKGTTSDGTGGSGVSSVKWFIPTNQQVEAWAKTGEEAMTATAKDALFTNTINGTYSWAIEFNSDSAAGKLQAFYSSTTVGGTTTWHNYPAGGNSSTTYGTQVDGSSALYDLPIYFRIEDNVGNVAYHTSYTVRVNPDGDRPVATILYPTLKEDPTTHVMGPDTLSGSIRINGEASDEVDEVKEVHIQIQKSRDNTNTEATEWEDVAGYSDVLATGTYKWNYSFDSSQSVFDPVGGGATATHLRFRVWAIDAKDIEGDKSEWTVIRTDKDNPLIGKTNKLRIVKYKNNTPSTSASDIDSSVEYEEGMYVSGTVFLEFSVEDASGLKEITAGVGTNSIIQSMDFVPTNQSEVSTGFYGYDKVRVKLVTTGSGSLNFTIKAVENTDNNYSSTRDIKLRYDNTAPTLESLKHGGDEVGLGAGKVTVKQSDGKYSLKSVINENDSGLAQMFMFWTRTKSGEGNENKKRVYDPRKSENNVFYGYGDTSTIAFNADGLPYRRYTGNTDETAEPVNTGLTTATTSTFTLNEADPFLTVANYVLIDGSYRQITAIDSAGTTYTFNPATETEPTTVDAIYAIAIDNERTESSDFSSGDDGDGIWESLVDAGSTYEWEMNFNSHNIPDGPVTISCLAIDTAGNKSELQETVTKIENNAPRIAKVMLGTDLNKDKSISKQEIKVYNRYKEENNLKDVADLSSEIALDTNEFTVKSGFAIIPEFVGGNGNSMKMVLKRGVDGKKDGNQTYITYLAPNSTATTGTKGELMVSEFTSIKDVMTEIYTPVVSGKDDERSMLSTKTNGVRDRLNSSFKKFFLTNEQLFGTGTIENTASGSSEKIGLTFWDATEETVQGTDSQTAVLYLTNMKYEMVDKEAPKVVIKPFKWVSKDDNSLYENSTANGHIELEDDLSGGTWNGYTENAPKVSGKIVFRGTAYDNVGLSKLIFSYGTTQSQINARYNNSDNTWAVYSGDTLIPTGGTMDSEHWHLEVYNKIDATSQAAADVAKRKNFSSSDAYFGQDGHKVAWEFALDTEKWTNAGTNPAAIGAKLTVTAEDNSTDNSGSYNSSSTTPSTGDDEKDTDGNALTGVALDRVKNKSVYVMDVVPYITKVTTGRLSSIDADASTYGRTSSGRYPVGTDETDLKIEGFNIGTNATISDGKEHSIIGYSSGTAIPIGSMETGDWKVTVNGVDSINNINNNNASGSSGKIFTATTDDYDDLRAYAYNRAPNTTNNYRLTDDFKIDVWQISPNVVTPNRGELNDPVMHVNPANDLIGFSFLNGDADFSMPTGTGSKYHTDYQNGETIDAKSYQWWQHNYADFNSNGFEYDEDGAAYACVAGLDTEPETKLGGRFTFMTSKWGTGNLSKKDDNYLGNNTIIFESIGLQNCIVQGTWYNDLLLTTKRFIGSPSFATAVHGTGDNKTTTVYLAYYDDIQGQIRFKYGELGSSVYNPKVCDEYTVVNDNKKVLTGDNWDNCAKGAKFIINGEVYTVQRRDWINGRMELTFDKEIADNGTKVQCKIVTLVDSRSTKSEFGNFENRIDFNSKYINGNTAYESHTNQWALIAGKDYQQGTSPDFYDTGYKAYRYVDIACVKGNTAADDTIHAVWYDGKDCYYSYIVNPTTGIDMGKEAVNGVAWATPKKIFTKGGEYCQIAVDPMGGIHIAAACSYKLKYAYLANKEAAATYSEATNSCLVDGYQLEGTRLQLEVLCKDVTVNGTSTKVAVPYISYFMMSTQLPKMAYLNIADTVTSVNHVPAGTDGNVKYTGDWEISLVPTGNNVNDDRVNIGVWKDANGYAKTSYTTGTSIKDTTNKNGIVYGNGKAYPVIGYACRDGSNYGIEIAQKK